MSVSAPREIVHSIGPHSTVGDLRPLLDHPRTDESHLLQLMRKRELASSLLEAIARHERWASRHVVRGAIVNHPKTPKTLALRLLTLLFWKELLKVTANVRLAMPIRIAAERRLKEKLPELELGEKISLARTAPPGLIALLAEENDEGLIRALLTNPRLRETDVSALVSRTSILPGALRVVAQSEQWSHRPAIRKAILSHPNAPVHVALALLERLRARDVRNLLRKGVLPRVVALAAERRLEKHAAGGGGIGDPG